MSWIELVSSSKEIDFSTRVRREFNLVINTRQSPLYFSSIYLGSSPILECLATSDEKTIPLDVEQGVANIGLNWMCRSAKDRKVFLKDLKLNFRCVCKCALFAHQYVPAMCEELLDSIPTESAEEIGFTRVLRLAVEVKYDLARFARRWYYFRTREYFGEPDTFPQEFWDTLIRIDCVNIEAIKRTKSLTPKALECLANSSAKYILSEYGKENLLELYKYLKKEGHSELAHEITRMVLLKVLEKRCGIEAPIF